MTAVSTAAAQAHAFYADVLATGTVWTVRDAEGFPAPQSPDGHRSMPFWSTRARVERVIATVPACAAFQVVEIALEDWRAEWLPDLAGDGLRAGLNWAGPAPPGTTSSPQRSRRP
jgi:hypothetical protein